jgi:hypothetical protein
MEQQGVGTAVDLEALALAFVAQVQGAWTPEALAAWRAELTRQGQTPAVATLEAALERAQQRFYTGTAHLLLCAGRPCGKRQKFDASPATLQRLAAECHLTLSTTECQGPCKQAPVATLRVGQRSEMLAQFVRQADWQLVLDFARRAAAGTLLVDAGPAEPFRFDPVHDHDHGSVPLRRLRFLVGHFQGEGRYATGGETFLKEMVGTWEVSGRCLALRMGVTFPLADGRKDTHSAFVAVGVNPHTDQVEARAYSDGGEVHDYHLRLDGETVCFDDRPASHLQAQRAQKIIRPTADGFTESLELDYGNGRFEPHYTITMRRVTPSTPGSIGQ